MAELHLPLAISFVMGMVHIYIWIFISIAIFIVFFYNIVISRKLRIRRRFGRCIKGICI